MLALFIQTAIIAVMSLASFLYGTNITTFFGSITIPPPLDPINSISALHAHWALFGKRPTPRSGPSFKSPPFISLVDGTDTVSAGLSHIISAPVNRSIVALSTAFPLVSTFDQVSFPSHSSHFINHEQLTKIIASTRHDILIAPSDTSRDLFEYDLPVVSLANNIVLSDAQTLALIIILNVASQHSVDYSNLRSYIQASENVSEQLFAYMLDLVHGHSSFLPLVNTLPVQASSIDPILHLPSETLSRAVWELEQPFAYLLDLVHGHSSFLPLVNTLPVQASSIYPILHLPSETLSRAVWEFEQLFTYLLDPVHGHNSFLPLVNSLPVQASSIDSILHLPSETLSRPLREFDILEEEEKRICTLMYRTIKPEPIPVLDLFNLPGPVASMMPTLPSARIISTSPSPTFIMTAASTDVVVYHLSSIHFSADTFDWRVSSQALFEWWLYSGYGDICEGAARKLVSSARARWFKFLWDGIIVAMLFSVIREWFGLMITNGALCLYCGLQRKTAGSCKISDKSISSPMQSTSPTPELAKPNEHPSNLTWGSPTDRLLELSLNSRVPPF